MKTNIDHLPASKQNELAHIVAVLRDEFEQITGFASGKKKHSRIVKIILFGSHATGKWVKDPANGYVSDYDILVILNRRELVEEYKIWNTAEDRIALRIKPTLNILIHTLTDVNNHLRKGHYFFTDIKREGIALFEIDRTELAEDGNLIAAEYKAIAEENYAQWFDSANEFFIDYENAFARSSYKKAAFELHQATERLYVCLLLVLTNYKPNTHNLRQLNSMAISQAKPIAAIFPKETKLHRRCFELLKHAYVEARYSEHYKINTEELEWLASRVEKLEALTEELCQEKIKSFEV